jgi:hypothetical protein
VTTLARYESDATDDAGNLLTSVTVEVRLESGGLASIYSDRAGTSPLGNPYTDADGHIGFHVAGGSYKITVTQGALSHIRRYVAIGLAAESDYPVPAGGSAGQSLVKASATDGDTAWSSFQLAELLNSQGGL